MDTREVACQYRMAQWSERIREQKLSGSTIKDWCAANGINRQQYFYWQRRLRTAACEQLAKATGGQETGLCAAGFAEVKLESPKNVPPSTGVLQIEAGGVRITTDSTYPAGKLAQLLRGLTRP